MGTASEAGHVQLLPPGDVAKYGTHAGSIRLRQGVQQWQTLRQRLHQGAFVRVGLLRCKGLRELGQWAVLCVASRYDSDGLRHELQQCLPLAQGQGAGVGHGVCRSGQQVADGHRGL